MRAGRGRGFTLVEVTIVFALAALVTIGLVGFYLSSQTTWLDGSTQALTQRDATLLVSTLVDSVRVARRAVVSDDPDSFHQTLTLYADPTGTVAFRCFYWRDSLVYMGRNGPAPGDQPVVASRIGRFQLSTQDSTLVRLDLVEVPCPDGRPILITSAAALHNCR